MSAAPLVTAALPLYRSARFHANIAANLERLDDARFEIIVSDRHLDDDTLARWRAVAQVNAPGLA